MNNDFSGVWRSRYWFPSNQHPGEEEISEHRVGAHQKGRKLTMNSLPAQNGAYITIKLTLGRDNLATGTWEEYTSPEGEFRGRLYSGAMQLIVSDDGTRMDGKWVGEGREWLGEGDDDYEQRIYTGQWELFRAEE